MKNQNTHLKIPKMIHNISKNGTKL